MGKLSEGYDSRSRANVVLDGSHGRDWDEERPKEDILEGGRLITPASKFAPSHTS